MKKVFRFNIVIGYQEYFNKYSNPDYYRFYMGEGISSRFIFEGNFLEGYIALDYITGYIDNRNIIHIRIHTDTGRIMLFEADMKNYTINGDSGIFLMSIIDEKMYCCIFYKEVEATEKVINEVYHDIKQAKSLYALI